MGGSSASTRRAPACTSCRSAIWRRMRAAPFGSGASGKAPTPRRPSLSAAPALDQPLRIIEPSKPMGASLAGYIGAVAMSPDGRIVAASAPRAGRIVYVDTERAVDRRRDATDGQLRGHRAGAVGVCDELGYGRVAGRSARSHASDGRRASRAARSTITCASSASGAQAGCGAGPMMAARRRMIGTCCNGCSVRSRRGARRAIAGAAAEAVISPHTMASST